MEYVVEEIIEPVMKRLEANLRAMPEDLRAEAQRLFILESSITRTLAEDYVDRRVDAYNARSKMRAIEQKLLRVWMDMLIAKEVDRAKKEEDRRRR